MLTGRRNQPAEAHDDSYYSAAAGGCRQGLASAGAVGAPGGSVAPPSRGTVAGGPFGWADRTTARACHRRRNRARAAAPAETTNYISQTSRQL